MIPVKKTQYIEIKLLFFTMIPVIGRKSERFVGILWTL